MTNRNVPRLRFKGFEDEWEKTTFEQTFDSVGGKSIEKYFDDNGDCKVISIGSYGENSSYVDQGIRVNKKDIDDKYVAHKGDLTMILNDKTTSGNIIGRVLLINNGNFVINQRTEKLSPKMDDSLFLYYLLNATRKQNMFKIVQGGTQIYVNYSAVEKLPLIISSKKEQQHIGNFFSKLDHLIDLHSQKLEQLKKLKCGYLQKMFPQKDEKVPRLRFSGFNGVWKEVKFGDICKVKMGQSPHSNNYTTDSNENILVQGNADLANGQVMPRLYTTEKTKISDKNDIIMTVRAPVGELAINQFNKVVIGRGVASIKGNEFIYNALKKINVDHTWDRVSSGSTFQAVNSEDIKSLNIKIPTILEQQKLGKLFKVLDNNIEFCKEKITKLKKQKKAYLQKMFI